MRVRETVLAVHRSSTDDPRDLGMEPPPVVRWTDEAAHRDQAIVHHAVHKVFHRLWGK